MKALLIDENLPRSLAVWLRTAGFHGVDVRDVGLRGCPDTQILEWAIAHDRILLSADLGFGRLVRSFLSFPGLILVRLPDEWPTERVRTTIETALASLRERDLTESLVVIEPDRLRVHQVAR